jgi:hypothetical protein
MRRDGIQHRMPIQREITVAPDRFEVAADDAILVTELRSAIAVCVYDAVEEAGALLHLRCIVRSPKPVDMTDSTLATELLLLDRCVESMRATCRHEWLPICPTIPRRKRRSTRF